MSPRDWTLLVIAVSKRGPLQPVHLQKAVFVVGRRLTREQLQTREFYTFIPYDYGPFCADVYTDAQELENDGLIHIDHRPDLSYPLYSATEAGYAAVRELRRALTPEVVAFVDRLVEWVTTLTFQQLVSAIYQAFPEMRVNSVFRE